MFRLIHKRFTQSSNILHKKGANDLAKAQTYSKATRHIVSAIKAMNPAALDFAKKNQVPKANIQEAIKRAIAKQDGDAVKPVVYEGRAQGLNVIVEALSSNMNKTAAEIKTIFKKSGGSLAAVGYLFEHVGCLHLPVQGQSDATSELGNSPSTDIATETKMAALVDAAIEAEAEDVQETPTMVYCYCSIPRMTAVGKRLEDQGIIVSTAERIYRPKEALAMADADQAKSFIQALENQEEVTRVYHDGLE